MSSSRIRLTFLILLLAAIGLTGCVDVEVVDHAASSPHGGPTSGQREAVLHDLAVLAVDFDPPLEYQEILECKSRGEGITLLIAVENTGISTERDVVVHATLSARSSQTAFAEKQGTIDSISPGEIKVVQLHDTDIPFRSEYTLSVSVLPVVGETRVEDNYRKYDLLVAQP